MPIGNGLGEQNRIVHNISEPDIVLFADFSKVFVPRDRPTGPRSLGVFFGLSAQDIRAPEKGRGNWPLFGVPYPFGCGQIEPAPGLPQLGTGHGDERLAVLQVFNQEARELSRLDHRVSGREPGWSVLVAGAFVQDRLAVVDLDDGAGPARLYPLDPLLAIDHRDEKHFVVEPSGAGIADVTFFRTLDVGGRSLIELGRQLLDDGQSGDEEIGGTDRLHSGTSKFGGGSFGVRQLRRCLGITCRRQVGLRLGGFSGHGISPISMGLRSEKFTFR